MVEEKKISNNKEGYVVCEGHCGKVFTYKFNMHRHLDSYTNIITCKHCGFKVRGGRNLRKHMLKSHIEYVEKLRCGTCGCEFVTEKMLNMHIKQHNPKIGDGKFKCERCVVYFSQKHSLQRHIRNIHN